VKRLAALVGAVALVVGAVLVRGAIDGDGGGGGGAGSGEEGRLQLVCSSALRAACDGLAGDDVAVRVEDDAVTAAALAGEDPPGVDAWLTTSPWPAIVAEDRELAGSPPVLGRPSSTLARSPATAVMRRDRAEAAAAACGGDVTWACVGGAADEPWTELGGSPTWGTVKPGLPDPDRSDGLVVLSQAAASRLGRTDFAANDFDDDPEFGPWFDQLVGAAKDAGRGTPSPLDRFLVANASFGAVGALEAEAVPAQRRAANGGDLAVIYPEPVVTADVVLVPAAGREAAEVVDRVGRAPLLAALGDAGWRVPGRDGPAGPALPAGSGLPAPGVLAALRERWEQVP
jgi:hypothetical protein